MGAWFCCIGVAPGVTNLFNWPAGQSSDAGRQQPAAQTGILDRTERHVTRGHGTSREDLPLIRLRHDGGAQVRGLLRLIRTYLANESACFVNCFSKLPHTSSHSLKIDGSEMA